jgi:hypothetical protein
MTNEELDAVEALAKATPETVEAVRPPSVKLRTLLAVGNDVVGFVEGPSREALVAFYTRARGSTMALVAEVREHRSEIQSRDASAMDLRAEVKRLRERLAALSGSGTEREGRPSRTPCAACDGKAGVVVDTPFGTYGGPCRHCGGAGTVLTPRRDGR